MSSKYTHCYSNYVNNILNNSPTKVTYTFPKSERFSPPKKQKQAPVDTVLQTLGSASDKKLLPERLKQRTEANKRLMNNFIESNRKECHTYRIASQRNDQLNRSRSKSQNKQIYPFEKYLNNEVVRTDPSKKFERSKSTKMVRLQNKQLRVPAPFDLNKTPQKKKKVWDKGESPNKSQNKRLYSQMDQFCDKSKKDNFCHQPPFHPDHTLTNNKYLKYSPYYRQYLAQNGEQYSLSRQKKRSNTKLSKSKQSKTHKRTKTPTIALQQIDYPSKHITVQGYYPVGTQINPNGKYIPSTYKNTPAHSFAKSPSKRQIKRKSPQTEKINFTADRSRTRLPNGAELYPEIGSYHRHLTDKKGGGKSTQRIEQSFVPFSQFGNINAFRHLGDLIEGRS